MNTKFDDLESDEGTIFESVVKFGDLDVKYEKWCWDGIYGESLILLNQDISQLSIDDLKADILASPIANTGSKFTVKTTGSYTFFSFSFNAE